MHFGPILVFGVIWSIMVLAIVGVMLTGVGATGRGVFIPGFDAMGAIRVAMNIEAIVVSVTGLWGVGKALSRRVGLASRPTPVRIPLYATWICLVVLFGAAAFRASTDVPAIIPQATYDRLVEAGLRAGFGVAATFPLTIALLVAVDWILYRWMNASHPDTVIVDRLLAVASTAETRAAHWADLRTKRRLTGLLEETAHALERDLPRRLRSGDASTDAWFRTSGCQMATATRDLKRWVLSPRLDTEPYFVVRVVATLIASACGNWDECARGDAEDGQARRWRVRASALARTLAVAFVPPLVLCLVQRSPLALSGSVEAWAKLGAVAWIMVAVLNCLGPAFGTNVSTLKDLASIVLPFGEGKG